MGDGSRPLRRIVGEVLDLEMAAALLDWDQQVNMPAQGAEARAQQMSTIAEIAHGKFASDETGRAIEMAEAEIGGDEGEARLVRVTRREYDLASKVPPEYVAEFARVSSLAQHTWEEARERAEYSLFEPHLKRIVELNRQYAEYFAPYEHVYDPLLRRFEPGMATSEVQRILAELRPKQVDLIERIRERPQVDDAFLHASCDERKQWEFGISVIGEIGFDWERGRQDRSAHPFTTNFSTRDVRITTRIARDFLPTGFFATLHECGHGLYEMGVDPSFERTHLGRGASLAVHESQSRLWENLVGRSRDFWIHYYPRLRQTFPGSLGDVESEMFYRAINKVEPSLIRVEADEATYNLHIMLRLELEVAMVRGDLDVKDLPEAWNQGMREYLGVTPSNDAEGVLQDIHWAGGMLGYFSTYALGNLIASQLWGAAEQDIAGLTEKIRGGAFGELLEWLRGKVHVHGAAFEPAELVRRVAGSEIAAGPYVQYLESKFGEIYGL